MVHYRGTMIWVTSEKPWSPEGSGTFLECRNENSVYGKISFKNEGEIETFSAKGKLREFISSKPVLKILCTAPNKVISEIYKAKKYRTTGKNWLMSTIIVGHLN